MDPCIAAVISKMEENLDLLSLIDFSADLVSEAGEVIKSSDNIERLVELHKDIFEIRAIIEKTYEKKYGKKLVWKTNDLI